MISDAESEVPNVVDNGDRTYTIWPLGRLGSGRIVDNEMRDWYIAHQKQVSAVGMATFIAGITVNRWSPWVGFCVMVLPVAGMLIRQLLRFRNFPRSTQHPPRAAPLMQRLRREPKGVRIAYAAILLTCSVGLGDLAIEKILAGKPLISLGAAAAFVYVALLGILGLLLCWSLVRR